MEENKYDYNPEEGYDYENEGNDAAKNSIRGYRVVIILLTIILAGLSALYFNINRQQKRDMDLMAADRDSIQNNLTLLIDEYGTLKYNKDSIEVQLGKANEMMEQLKRERKWNYAKIKAYQKELGTLRSVMKNYLRQIDSLNKVNKNLSRENKKIRKEKEDETLRADLAEERVVNLENKVKQGAVLKARDISIAILNDKDRPVSRIKRATKLRVDFTVGANELAQAGNAMVYLCLISPEGFLLTTEATPTFTYQGKAKGYTESREIDYQNADVDVSIFYSGDGFLPGTYKVELYMHGNCIGTSEIFFEK